MSQTDKEFDHLGGRLALLPTDELDGPRRAIYEALVGTVVPEGRHYGFTTRLADGRLIGPFNAMLRNPDITSGFGDWVRTTSQADLSDEVRQAVILTIGTHWQAPYEIYAHTAAARTAGIDEAAIQAILTGATPAGLTPAARLAQQLTAALLRDCDVPDQLYGDVIKTFGEAGTVALLALIGQYQTISSLLVTFRVPAPTDQPSSAG